jgi:hypothetical protein
LARHETEFDAAGEAKLSPGEALSLARGTDGAAPSREDALARFLSAGEGWVDAARALNGAFADCPALKPKKD